MKRPADAGRQARARGGRDLHDQWFRAEVDQALAEADDLAAEWIQHEAVKHDMAKQRAALQQRIADAGRGVPGPLLVRPG